MTTIDLKVDITAEDIAKGVPGSAFSCAFARAMSGAAGMPVTVDGLYVSFAGVREPVTLPPDAEKWVERFDNGEPVTPASFLIPVPVEALPASGA